MNRCSTFMNSETKGMASKRVECALHESDSVTRLPGGEDISDLRIDELTGCSESDYLIS